MFDTVTVLPPPPPPECVRRYSDKTVITLTLSSFQVQFPPFVLEKLYCYSGGRPERQALFTAIFSGTKWT